MNLSFGLLCQAICHCDEKLDNIHSPVLNPYIIYGDSADTMAKN